MPGEEADLNEYLNSEYYNSLTTDAQNLIDENGWFNVGTADRNYFNGSTSVLSNISDNVEQVKDVRWQGKIGLIDITEYMRSSTNSACDTMEAFDSDYGTDQCINDVQTYLYIANDPAFTLTFERGSNPSTVWMMGNNGSTYGTGVIYRSGVRPVVYIKSDAKIISGTGTSNDPYILSA